MLAIEIDFGHHTEGPVLVVKETDVEWTGSTILAVLFHNKSVLKLIKLCRLMITLNQRTNGEYLLTHTCFPIFVSLSHTNALCRIDWFKDMPLQCLIVKFMISFFWTWSCTDSSGKIIRIRSFISFHVVLCEYSFLWQIVQTDLTLYEDKV